MGFISEYKKSLFVNTKPLIGHAKKDLVRHFKIESKIPFDKSAHWIIYDFKNKKVMKRDINGLNTMMDFQENTYKDENDIDIGFDVASHIEKYQSDLMISCELPENKSILAIFDDTKYTKEDYDYLWYNLFHTHIRGKIYEKTKEEIDSISYKLIPKMNWVWFRKPGAYISERIIRRSSSWIELNPEIEFHLWTDLKNEQEAIDFFTGDVTDSETLLSRQEYMKKLIIHYKEDTWGVAKEFCEENSTILKGENLWEIYEEILNNKTDKSSMIFKTDIIRCMILHQKGGWYSDYNDTYCFIPLKYVINQDKRDLIYLGCDIYSNHNNYIMYSPKYHDKWLDLTSQIVKGGVNTYKILKIKDDEFTNVIRAIMSSFIKGCLSDNCKDNFLDTCIDKIAVWLKLYDSKIDETIAKHNINLPHSFHFTPNEILLMIRYIFVYRDPNTILSKRICYELEQCASLNKNRLGKYILRRKDENWDKTYLWKESLEEMEKVKDTPFENSTIMNTILFVNMAKLLQTTNMGAYFHGKKELEKYVYALPHCYVMGCFSFLTALGHIGDGTSAGGDIYEYNLEAI
jgi:hypothetical protein